MASPAARNRKREALGIRHKALVKSKTLSMMVDGHRLASVGIDWYRLASINTFNRQP
jgi:hypothetical protein